MKGRIKIHISVILVLAMVLGLCACGSRNGGGKGSGSLDLDYEGTDVAQDDQQEEKSGFQSWVNDVFSFGKKDADSSSSSGREGTSQGQTQQETSSPQSGTQSQSGKTNSGNSQSGSNNSQSQSSQTPQTGSSGQSSSGSSGNKNQSSKNTNSGSQSGSQSGTQNGSGTQTQQGTQTSQGGQSGTGNNNNNGGNSNTSSGKKTVTITIRCDTAVNNGMHLESKWAGIVPASGCILPVTTVEIEDGQTVFDVLAYVCSKYKIHMSYRGGTSSGCYVEGINNLYEFDGGRWSGWMYCVNGWYPNYGCGVYYVKAGEVIEWNYTCDLGLDLEGGDILGGAEWKETHP